MADFKTMFLRILWILLVMKSVDSVENSSTLKPPTRTAAAPSTTIPAHTLKLPSTTTTTPTTTTMSTTTTMPTTTNQSTTSVPTKPTKITKQSTTSLPTTPPITTTSQTTVISSTTKDAPLASTKAHITSTPLDLTTTNITATTTTIPPKTTQPINLSKTHSKSPTPAPTIGQTPTALPKNTQTTGGTISGGNITEETRNSTEAATTTTISTKTTMSITTKTTQTVTVTSPESTMPTKGTTEAQNGSKSKSKSYDRELVIIFGVMLGLMFVVIVIFGIHKCRHKNKESDDLPMSSADKYRNGGEDVTIAASSF